MSTTPPLPSDQPSEQPSEQSADPSHGAAQQPRRDPKRNLAGVGFALLGGFFAYSLWGVPMSLWLKAPLLLVFVGVALYGVVQLVQNRRS